MKLQSNLQQTSTSQSIRKQNSEKQAESQVSFGGGENLVQFMNFLQTNPTIGATFVDAGCMGTPRTVVDFTRSPEAGVETARREFSSTLNDVALGAYGMGAAWLLAKKINKDFGVDAHKMFVDNDSLDIFAQSYKDNVKVKNSENLKKYYYDVMDKVSGFNPNDSRADDNGYVKLSSTTQDKIFERVKTEFKDNLDSTSIDKKKQEALRAHVKALWISDTGAESEIKLERVLYDEKTQKPLMHKVNGKDVVKTQKVVTSIDDFIDNFFKTTKSFMSKEFHGALNQAKNGKIDDNVFINGLKKLNRNTALMGIAICSLIGISVQPINMYLTKKKTGKSGFVGGGEENKSTGFRTKKAIVAALAAMGAIATITKNPKNIIKEIQFKGLVPTIPQFKLVYGLTIVSRLLSARNDNELRESSIKDSLGFVNWLILGSFVSRLTALGIDKMDKFNGEKFIRYNEAEKGAGKWNWLTKASITTRQEVLHEALKKAGVDVMPGGKPITLKEMLVEAAKIDAQKGTKIRSRVKYLGLIQFAGYLYSGLVLGFGIPKLNIAITNAVEKKKKSAQKDATAQSAPEGKAADAKSIAKTNGQEFNGQIKIDPANTSLLAGK